MHFLLLAQVATEHTLLGTVEQSLLSLAALMVTALAAFVTKWIAAKASTTKIASVGAIAWEKAQSVVAHVDAELRPSIVKALDDGNVTKEEAAALKAQAMTLFKQALGDEGVGTLSKLLGLAGPSLETYLSGLIERALGVQRAATAAPASP